MRFSRNRAACATLIFVALASTTGCLSICGRTTNVHENPETEQRLRNLECRIAELEAQNAALNQIVNGP
jgi:hypothetical protein